MIVTLLVSTGAVWEARALAALTEHPGVVVLKRCVDVDDLLATASAGQAEVAILGAELTGLDAAVVAELQEYGVRALAVAGAGDAAAARLARWGVRSVLPAERVDTIGDAVCSLAAAGPELAAETVPAPAPVVTSEEPRPGRTITVWGPGGGAGRTTLAIGLAAELARRQVTTVLVDADPYGGAVAQHLGVLDEVSGLLAAARLVAGGGLAEQPASVQRRLSDRLRLVTGLPRADRWAEVRPGALDEIVAAVGRDAQVVLDTGFSLEAEPDAEFTGKARRNGLTIEALEAADEVLVVGAADPVGIARMARALGELHASVAPERVRLVVNRMRPSLGWKEPELVRMLDGFGPNVGVHFLPDDPVAVDRALVSGRTLLEGGDSPLCRGIAGLIDAMAGVSTGPTRSRPPGRARRQALKSR